MPQYIDVEAFETRFKQLINEATSLPPHEANQMAYNLVAVLKSRIIKDLAGNLAKIQPHGITMLCASVWKGNPLKRHWQVSVECADKDNSLYVRTLIEGQARQSRKEAVEGLQDTVEFYIRTEIKPKTDCLSGI